MELPIEIKTEPRTDMNTSQSKENNCSPNEDTCVDILESVIPDGYQCEEEDGFQDVASTSSSFTDSVSVPDDFGLGNDEAQSFLSEDYPLPSFFDGSELFCMRKKKMTAEWRKFVNPLMWRCRWLELKVRELQSQARMYDREIANSDLTKQFELEKLKLEGYDAKSIPFPIRCEKGSVLERLKRKRVEETTDIAAYMSRHNLFSYAENRMPGNVSHHYHDLDRKTTNKENEIEDDCLVSELKFSDDFAVNILRKIGETQEKTARLKMRVNELMREPPTLEIVKSGDPDPDDPIIDSCRQSQSLHLEDLPVPSIQKEFAVQNVEQCLMSISPNCFGGGVASVLPIFEDMEEEMEMKEDEIATEEELDYFRKVINEVTRVPRLSSEEPEDPREDEVDDNHDHDDSNHNDVAAPNTISMRVKTRKRKRQRSWMSSTSARKRAAALRRKTTL